MNLTTALVASLYTKVNKRRVLRNLERYEGSLLLLPQKNLSACPDTYKVAHILSISLDGISLGKHSQILQEIF